MTDRSPRGGHPAAAPTRAARSLPLIADAALEEAFRDLGRIQAEPDGAADLLQFRALATAHQYRLLYDAVARHFRPRERLLDWGCGNGHVSWTLLRLGWERVVAFGFEDFPLRPRMPRGFTFERGDEAEPVRLPFADGSFDGVLSVGVLEHVRETGGTEEGSLEEIVRVLKPGGRFLCAHFPNRGSWIEFIARRVPGKHHHPYLYDRRRIEALVRVAGLELLEVRTYGMLPRNTWARVPGSLRRSSAAARLWDVLDAGLERLLPGLAQNHLWVGRKPAARAGAAPDPSGAIR